jgi:hypothetical protein
VPREIGTLSHEELPSSTPRVNKAGRRRRALGNSVLEYSVLMFGIRQNWVIPFWNVQDWRIPASDSVIIIFNVFFFFFSFFFLFFLFCRLNCVLDNQQHSTAHVL